MFLTVGCLAGKLVSMVASVHTSSVRRLMFPVLVVLLVLGHACELPAYADLVGSAHSADQESHHSGRGHHAGEPAISCDGVGVTSSPGYVHVPVALEISMALGVDDPAPLRLVVRRFENPAKLAFRPPLFLLHASLLI